MADYEPQIAINIWPEVLDRMSDLSLRMEVTRSEIARMAVSEFLVQNPDQNIPTLESIIALYPPEIDFKRPLGSLPHFGFYPEKGTTQLFKKATTIARGARLIITYGLPFIDHTNR